MARVAAALGARLSLKVYWRGEGLDRLRDGRHAALVERMVRMLGDDGWEVRPEVTFNEFGERGSIDILAFHPVTGALLVVEVKSVVPDLQAMLASLDRKVRLGPTIAKRSGWSVRTVSRLLVFPDDRTARRRVEQHAATFATTFPDRTVAVKRWLGHSTGEIAGIIFLSGANGEGRRHNRVSRGEPKGLAPGSTTRLEHPTP